MTDFTNPLHRCSALLQAVRDSAVPTSARRSPRVGNRCAKHWRKTAHADSSDTCLSGTGDEVHQILAKTKSVIYHGAFGRSGLRCTAETNQRKRVTMRFLKSRVYKCHESSHIQTPLQQIASPDRCLLPSFTELSDQRPVPLPVGSFLCILVRPPPPS